MTEITKEEIERANEFLVDVRGYCNANHEAWIRDIVRELALYAAHVTAEKDKEIERLWDLSEKYKWQVRDTCIRAEKAEAEVRETRDILAASDAASLPKDYPTAQMAADRLGELARLRAEIERLRGSLSNLVEAVDDLISESEGVYGLRLDGTPSLWEELIEVGWLLALEEARAVLDGEKADD